MSNRARKVRRAYGQGVNQFVDDAKTLPTAYNLAVGAIGDADAWWTRQGSAPQPLDLQVAPSHDGEHNGFGYYNTGRVDITPGYLENLNGALAHSATRRGQIQALVGLWRLMAHERGHNIGYDHIPGGIMDAGWTSPPGEAYEWAAKTLPRQRVRRKRH